MEIATKGGGSIIFRGVAMVINIALTGFSESYKTTKQNNNKTTVRCVENTLAGQEEEVTSRFDQDTFFVCMRLLKNEYKIVFKKSYKCQTVSM